MSEGQAIERLLRRDRLIVAAALAGLCALAWLHIVTGAGLGMDMRKLAVLALFPHTALGAAPIAMDMAGMPGMDMSGETAATVVWSPRTWALTVAMWGAMMVAMMVPSATPAILLYGRVRAQTRSVSTGVAVADTGAFAAGYLLVWLAFSMAAAALQFVLEGGGLLSPASMGSSSKWLSAAVLMAAAAWQLSPLKNVCLVQCRSPTQFLTRHWRPGVAGAVRLGVLHGAWCLGCCWMLMVLLFVGGIMNLAWIAVITLLVAAEKLAPKGPWVARAAGLLLAAWGVATLVA